MTEDVYTTLRALRDHAVRIEQAARKSESYDEFEDVIEQAIRDASAAVKEARRLLGEPAPAENDDTPNEAAPGAA